MDAALKNPNKRRRRRTKCKFKTLHHPPSSPEGLQSNSLPGPRRGLDEEIVLSRFEWRKHARQTTQPEIRQASYPQVMLLPEVVALLNRNTVQHSIVDPIPTSTVR